MRLFVYWKDEFVQAGLRGTNYSEICMFLV